MSEAKECVAVSESPRPRKLAPASFRGLGLSLTANSHTVHGTDKAGGRTHGSHCDGQGPGRTHTLCMAPIRPEAARTDHTVTDRAQAEGRHGRGHITYCAMIHARCTTNSHTVHGTDKAGGRKPITL